MKQHIRPFLFALLTLTALAVGTDAATSLYREPTVGPSGDSGEYLPITIGDNAQVKEGGFTIQSPFIARGKAWFQGNTYIKGFAAGANPAVSNSIVAFGRPSNTVSVDVTGNAAVKEDFQTDSLMPGGFVCADSDGTLVICSPDENFCEAGSIPDGNGGCIPMPCVVFLTFEGAFRHGRIVYTGPTPVEHPALTVTAILTGIGNHTVTTGERPVVFTIPSNSTTSYFNGEACGQSSTSGCGIEGVNGFHRGWTESVVPEYIAGGRVCVQGN